MQDLIIRGNQGLLIAVQHLAQAFLYHCLGTGHVVPGHRIPSYHVLIRQVLDGRCGGSVRQALHAGFNQPIVERQLVLMARRNDAQGSCGAFPLYLDESGEILREIDIIPALQGKGFGCLGFLPDLKGKVQRITFCEILRLQEHEFSILRIRSVSWITGFVPHTGFEPTAADFSISQRRSQAIGLHTERSGFLRIKSLGVAQSARVSCRT